MGSSKNYISIMKKLVTFFAVTAFLLFGIMAPAHAHDPLMAVTDCSTSSNPLCIESIFANLPDGVRIKGQLNGRNIHEIRTYAPDSVLDANWQEYEFPGVTFDAGTVKTIFPRIFYYPLGNQDCFYTPCVQGAEYLETVITPGDRVNGATAQHVFPPTSEACVGKTYYPGSPTPTNFGIKVTFEVKLRVPHDVMNELGYGALGRGISTSSSQTDDSNPNYTLLTISVTPSSTSSFGCAGAQLANQGDFETDQVTYWIWGLNDIRMQSFGKCESVRSVSVVSNAFWDSFPQWNRATQSVEVNLSGPHLRSDGSINAVNFQARITNALAECLWNVDLTHQPKVQFSLLYDSNGEAQTQTLSGVLEGDTYVLNVNGIHLSSPTLSFKFTNAVTSAASPSPSTSASSSQKSNSNVQQKSPAMATTQKSIYCIKGTIKKKIAGSKCPAGYKASKN